ncbi:Starch-binding associating with outer membrane [Tenacibaculum sp. MAR_2009_124]|uniref:SusD/RagB family nutrient-binding outer membrane lipoprotein n=1 Tax=Tenacibaculum sp. MAR_2009_124 TaxID=1250059 RepID=UPI00089B3A0F|nr:SusD/RagB family nutrient-binding outer membrane lipoprotein [Tenacibaculum sp. MAR_2009_124]SEB78286.1 Starch-binding associating with outer membrane [Tenacibaculum sp. MAR_2009_124]
MKKIYILGLIFTMFTMSSCEEFLKGTNENPNDPTSVSPAALLAPAETVIAYQYGGNFSRYSGLFVQQVEGMDRQWASFNNYVLIAANFDSDWQLLYVDVLNNLNIMIEQSETAGYNHYIGVGKALKAFSLLLMTDFWNSIPYSNGLSGVANLQPTFDSQADIFTEVHKLLTEARTSLGSSDGGLALSGDLIYGGNTAAWMKATHAIQARAYLHQSLLDSNNYNNAITSIDNAFSSESEDMTFDFVDGATTAGPWYQFNRDRGDIGFNSTMNTVMTNLSDPRLDKYDGDGTSTFLADTDTHEYFTAGRSLPLVSYTELMFAKAEALLQSGGSQADIRTAYLAGINSSFNGMGLSADYAAYTAQDAVNPAADLTLENIITQKWLALYTDPEAYSDWRRTGFPALTPNNGVAIPTRFLYPQTENQLNSNTPSVTVTDKVDWDTN